MIDIGKYELSEKSQEISDIIDILDPKRPYYFGFGQIALPKEPGFYDPKKEGMHADSSYRIESMVRSGKYMLAESVRYEWTGGRKIKRLDLIDLKSRFVVPILLEGSEIGKYSLNIRGDSIVCTYRHARQGVPMSSCLEPFITELSEDMLSTYTKQTVVKE